VATDDRSDPRLGVDLADDARDPVVPDPDAPADVPTEVPVARGRRELPSWLPWVLVVLAVALAAFSTWRWQELAGTERAREDVSAASSAFVTTLTTWDASAGMQTVRDELRDGGTETFARDVDELFGSTEDLRGLAELGATSEGTVEDVFVQRLSGDVAETLVVVVQRVSTQASDFPEVHRRFASLVLQHTDGRWLVEDLELLVDTAPASGAPAAPAEEAEDAGQEPGTDDQTEDAEGDA
jgi:hypothetical protein